MISMTLGQIASAMEARCDAADRETRVDRVVTDSRDARAGDLFFAIPGPRCDGHEFVREAIARGAVACVCSREPSPKGRAKGAPAPCLIVTDTVAALGQLAAYYRRNVLRPETVVVAVTGSNGKTTTKCMIDHVLGGSFPGRASPKSFNNQIGVPLTLLSAEPSDRYLILEIGTNALGEIAALADIATPNAAVITSIGEAHLQAFGTTEAIAAEKASLLNYVRPGGLAVVNVDRLEIRPHLLGDWGLRVVSIGFTPGAKLTISDAWGTIQSTTFVLDGRHKVELPMPGVHHATNAAAAFAVARWFGLAPEEILERLRTFVPPAGRTCVQTIGGVTLVDDTYNANPASVAAAIHTLRTASTGRRVLVLGDMLELGRDEAAFHRRTVRAVVDAGIEILVAVGPQTAQAARELHGTAPATELLPCADSRAADDVLAQLARPGDTIWIKASRGMQLDWLVRRWETRSLPAAAVA